jgi:RNA polymerase sigma-70 factor (ECF subfamily)
MISLAGLPSWRPLQSVRDRSDREDIVKVEEFLSGELSAFEFLFDKYREKVYRIAYRFVRNKEDALEIAQDVFLRVYTNLRKFKTDSKFFTWLYRIAVNRSIDFTRSRKGKPIQQIDPIILDAQPRASPGRHEPKDPSARAEAKELDEKLAEAVSTLSEKHRTVFLLHAVENLSYKEIAAVMGSSIGTVMSRLFYARKKLQETLGNMGLAPAKRLQETRSQKAKAGKNLKEERS